MAAETTPPRALPTVPAEVVAETEARTHTEGPPTDTVPPETRFVVVVVAGEVVIECATVLGTFVREAVAT